MPLVLLQTTDRDDQRVAFGSRSGLIYRQRLAAVADQPDRGLRNPEGPRERLPLELAHRHQGGGRSGSGPIAFHCSGRMKFRRPAEFPPVWRSTPKGCGTVRRPVRWAAPGYGRPGCEPRHRRTEIPADAAAGRGTSSSPGFGGTPATGGCRNRPPAPMGKFTGGIGGQHRHLNPQRSQPRRETSCT